RRVVRLHLSVRPGPRVEGPGTSRAQRSRAGAILFDHTGPLEAEGAQIVSMPTHPTDDVLAARIVNAPGVLRAGAGCWDRGRTPIHPLTLESAYADPDLLRALGARGARCAREFGVDVIVGAETGGVPLAAAVSLAGGVPFAFVRK